MQETLLAIQIERSYTKQQIFTMYANQVYLVRTGITAGGGVGILFQQAGRQAHAAVDEAVVLAALIRGPATRRFSIRRKRWTGATWYWT